MVHSESIYNPIKELLKKMKISYQMILHISYWRILTIS